MKTGEEILEDMKDAANTVVDAANSVVDAARPVVKKARDAAAPTVQRAVKASQDAAQKAVKAGQGAAQKAAKVSTEAAQKAAAAAKKATPKKPEYYVQFNGREVNMDALAAKAKAQFKQANKRAAVLTCRIYLKPEDNTAYYVINDTFFGRISV